MAVLLGLFSVDAPALPMSADAITERCARYRPLSAGQLRAGEALFAEMFRGPVPDEERLRQRWSALGFELSERTLGSTRWWELKEPAKGCRGQGHYLVRQQHPVRHVLQVPHGYTDLDTGAIASRMLDGPFDLIAWNSARRDTTVDGDDEPADLARRGDSLFAALTAALAEGEVDVRVVQLHGFSNAQRKTRAGAEAAVIVSGGSRWITPSADAVARCLAEFVDGPVALFPRDVTELGATTNLHGKILRRHGHEGFVHIELNLATRRWLLDDTARLQRFAGCLQQE